MALGSTFSWGEAFQDFLVSLEAQNKAEKTVIFYRSQLRQLIRWADEERVPLEKFGKRDLDRYLSVRRKTVSRTTLRHDAVAAVAFFKWCYRNDLLERNPLAEYQVNAAPKTSKYVPTEDEVRGIFKAIAKFWDPAFNPGMANIHVARRNVQRDRNRAMLLMLVDSAARIGEVTSLKLEDYRKDSMEIRITEAKGKQPRSVPLRPGTVEVVEAWLRVRARLMKNAEEDEGWLFLSEYGSKVDPCSFGKAIKRVTEWAGINSKITLHDFRHYSLTVLAKNDFVSAQQIAGHKNPRTTQGYIHLDADYVRERHAQAGAVDAILENRRLARKKRLT